jgi:hypothetical protein
MSVDSVFSFEKLIVAFAATGSSDPDVLFARKEELLAQIRRLRSAALTDIVVGVMLSFTLVGAFVGVSIVNRGRAKQKIVAEYTKAVDLAYKAYLIETAGRRTRSQNQNLRSS